MYPMVDPPSFITIFCLTVENSADMDVEITQEPDVPLEGECLVQQNQK